MTDRRVRYTARAAITAAASLAIGVGLIAVPSPAQATFTPLVQYTATVSSPDTSTSPPAAPATAPITLAFRVTNTSNVLVVLGRVSVTAPTGFTLTTPAVATAGWSAAVSGRTVTANVTKPLLNPGIWPGQSVVVSVKAINTLTVTDPTTTTWPVAGSGPLGVVRFALQGANPTVVVLPVGVTAFAAAPNTPLTGIAPTGPTGGLCALNPANPICSTANLGQGAIGNVYFGQTTCATTDPTCPLGTQVNLSGDFGQLYSNDAPASVVLTCLAAKCPPVSGTSSLKSSKHQPQESAANKDFAAYPVFVQPKGATTFTQAPRCVPKSDTTTTGHLTDPAAISLGFCVDVNAITRLCPTAKCSDDKCDLVRPVLFVEDPRMR